jgi:poly(hydroxyalkanoate) depolymerase family esterase
MNKIKNKTIKRNRLTTYKIFISLIFTLIATNSIAAMTGSGDVYSGTFQGSRDRDYKVYVPQSYDGTTAVPMIMALHGCVMNNTDALDLWNLDLIADQNNVILVLPYVTSFTEMRSDDCWGYWFANHVQEGGNGEVDDIHDLAVQIESQYNIDPTRRYITGISSGGAITVAAGIAYNDYWAAAAPVAGLPYGDWASSVTSDMFQSLQTHIDKINAELNDTRAIPMLVIQSSNDTTVMPEAMELIRDSQLTVWGADLNADASESCSNEGIACTLTTYNGTDGTPLIKTMLYAGVNAKTATYGKGHYWTGDDEYENKWAKEQGPSASQNIWAFFEQITSNGFEQPACENDSLAPATPTGLTVVEPHDQYTNLTVNANSEEDLKGYKIYKADGTSLTSSPVVTTSIVVSGLSTETAYQVYATAVDQCGNESTPSSSISFTTTALEYVAPTASGTCTDHYVATRLDTDGYLACGSENGYSASVTLWQKQDGTWTTEDLNNGNTGGGGTGGTGTPGSWVTNSNQAGMEVHVYTPTATTSNGKRALMISLHGCAQANEVVRDNWSWADEADEYGMVVAAPMAPNGGVIFGCWDYYDVSHSRANPGRHDDNLIALAEDLIANSTLNIDPDQVYVSGLSSGGGETFVMGCLAPEIFAGIGINAGPAVGTTSGQIGSVAVSATQAKNTCLSFADNGNQSAFQSQLTSIVHGSSDTTVAQDYADVDAEAMAMIYGVSKDSGSNIVTGGGTEETWSDIDGVRVSEIKVSGLSHAWPAGSDSSGGGYTDHGTVDYPAFLTAFLFTNNRRADFTSGLDTTAPAVPSGLSVTNITANSISIDWNAVSDADLASYSVYNNGVLYTTKTATTITVTGLTAETAYSLSVSATDSSANESVQSGAAQATTIANSGGSDTVKPVISLLGSATFNLTEGDSFTDLGATANDNVDGNISTNITASGTVNTNSAGTYTLSYNVSDAAGNAANTVTRTITVAPAATACEEVTAANYYHKTGGRAHSSGSYWTPNYFTNGSNETMSGSTWGSTTLYSTVSGVWHVGSCP